MKLTRPGSEERDPLAAGFHPNEPSASHIAVHDRAAFDSENCPPLACATSIGPTIRNRPAVTVRSGM